MDCREYITYAAERKRGQHLQREERGAIQQLKREGYSNRAIAKRLHCSPTTVGNELKRGTPPRNGNRGRKPEYLAKRGQAVYEGNRKRSCKPHKVERCKAFVAWVIEKIRNEQWSLDACVGYARLHRLFPEDEATCTKTLYNEVWSGRLELSITELPEAVKRKQHRECPARKNKKTYGTSIEKRPEVASLRTECGHWEVDTVVGKRAGQEAVVFSLLEKKTQNYLAMLIPGKTSDAVMTAMGTLKEEYGNRFSQVFKTITADNGSEFSDFAHVEEWGSKVYFTHPYTSWERPQNERHNGLFRAYVPKGVSMAGYTPEQILSFADSLNGRPRKKLGYRTPEELFDNFLDEVFTACGP